MKWRIGVLAVILATTVPANLTLSDRERAIERGLRFIYQTAQNPKNFSTFGSDYLWCFYEISATSLDPRQRAQATAMGRERAVQWWREHTHIDPAVSADELADTLFGAYAAERLGFPDDRFKAEIRKAAARFRPIDFLRFDPAVRPPQAGLLDLLCDALIATYTADQYGVTLGAPYHDIVRWVPLARPYRVGAEGMIPVVNLVTHVVYTANDYNNRPLSPAMLPEEFAFLKDHINDPLVQQDGEMLGEFLDTLRAFGLTRDDDSIRRGFSTLLSRQNPDGSWGDLKDPDIYNRYHPTWTAIDGLRDYSWSHGRM